VTEEIKNYLLLADKSDLELKTIAESLELSIPSTREELISNLLGMGEKVYKTDILSPQLIPLRSLDSKGKSIPRAKETFLKWRRLIFKSRATKEFEMITIQGKQYFQVLSFIPIGEKAIQTILSNKWYHPQSNQIDIIQSLKTTPEAFSVNLVQRQNGDKDYLMLHISPKEKE